MPFKLRKRSVAEDGGEKLTKDKRPRRGFWQKFWKSSKSKDEVKHEETKPVR
jgi:hypothetical protein